MDSEDPTRSRRCARKALTLVGVNVAIVLLVVAWSFIAGQIVGHGEPPGPQFAYGFLMLLVLIPAGILFLINAIVGTAFSIAGLRTARRLGDKRYAKGNKIALAIHAGLPLVYALFQVIVLVVFVIRELLDSWWQHIP